MPGDERQELLDRLTALNGGDSYLADLYALAELPALRDVVAQMEAADRDQRAAGGHLAATWMDDNAVIIDRSSRQAAE